MIKGINLIPDEVQFEWRFKSLRHMLAFMAIVYMAALALFFMSQRSSISTKRSEITSLAKQKELLIATSTRYRELHGRLQDFQRTEADMKRRLDVAGALTDKKISWSMLLKRLSNEVPSDAWLRAMSTSDEDNVKKIRLAGGALSNKGVTDLVFHLENIGFLKDVFLLYSQKKDYGKTMVYDFEITAVVVKGEEILYD